MLVACDIGNTNVVFAVFGNGRIVTSFRIHTDVTKTSDENFVTLNALFRENGIVPAEVSRTVISSVVPNLTRNMEKNLTRLFGIKPLIISLSSESGLVKESIPQELGSDLLCNLAYAHAKKPEENVMVVDFGTALTLSTVNRNGEVVGVAIAPGLITAVNALFGNTAQLPQVGLKIPEKAMGRNSQESIRSGIMLGYAGLVSSLIERTEKEIGDKLYVIATGGLSATIAEIIPRIDEVDAYHTLKGIELIAMLSR